MSRAWRRTQTKATTHDTGQVERLDKAKTMASRHWRLQFQNGTMVQERMAPVAYKATEPWTWRKTTEQAEAWVIFE